MSALDLDALEGLCDAATPGPWKVEDEHTVMDLVGFCVAGTEWESDGAFIAAAREAVPALITRLRAAEARTAWQPIETAPRDCCVIGWADEWARPDVAWYCAGAWWSGCGSPCPEITHWMPLPAAPEAPHG